MQGIEFVNTIFLRFLVQVWKNLCNNASPCNNWLQVNLIISKLTALSINDLCAVSAVIWTIHYFFLLSKPDMVNLILTSLSFTKFQESLNTTTVQLEHTRVLRWLEYKARVNCWAVPLLHYVIASPLRIYMRIVIFHFIHQIQAARIVLKLAHSCSQYNSITIYTRHCFVICCFVIQFRLSIFIICREVFFGVHFLIGLGVLCELLGRHLVKTFYKSVSLSIVNLFVDLIGLGSGYLISNETPLPKLFLTLFVVAGSIFQIVLFDICNFLLLAASRLMQSSAFTADHYLFLHKMHNYNRICTNGHDHTR